MACSWTLRLSRLLVFLDRLEPLPVLILDAFSLYDRQGSILSIRVRRATHDVPDEVSHRVGVTKQVIDALLVVEKIPPSKPAELNKAAKS